MAKELASASKGAQRWPTKEAFFRPTTCCGSISDYQERGRPLRARGRAAPLAGFAAGDGPMHKVFDCRSQYFC